MTRRQITARRIAAGVELFVLAAALAACAASSGNSAATPPAAGTAAGTSAAAGSSASTGSSEENAPAAAATIGNIAADPADPTASASPASADLTIKDNVVSPASLTVSPGTQVTIANSDTVAHDLSDSKDKLSSGVMKAESTGSLTAPKSAGTYRLTDPSHSGSHVTLVVK